MHLLGKCKAGDSCSRIHNPPCRFFQKGACAKGKDCVFPHYQPTAAAAKSDEEPADGSTGEKRQARGRSKDRLQDQSAAFVAQDPGKPETASDANSYSRHARRREGTNLKKSKKRMTMTNPSAICWARLPRVVA